MRLRPRPISLHRRASTSGAATRTAAVRPRGRTIRSSAKFLPLDDGTHRLALVTLDLGRTFGVESMDVVRRRGAGLGRRRAGLLLRLAHALRPVHQRYVSEGKAARLEERALDHIAAAIEQAAGRLQPAALGVGEGEVLIGHNRRFVRPDGTVKMLWRNATKTPTHPVDSRVGVLRVDGRDGRTLAVLVNYACHPVVFGPIISNTRPTIRARWPAWSSLRSAGTVCLFLQGAAGDINPYFDKTPLAEDAEKLMQETGRELGREALRVARSIVPKPPDKPELQFALDMRHFQHRYEPQALLAQLKGQVKPEVIERYRGYLAAPLDCPVTTLLINRQIALVGMPGEPFVEFGLAFRDRSPAVFSLFGGYANGYHGYFPTICAAVEGGYGAEGLVSRAEVGAGETMLDTGLIRLHTMLGQLKPLPQR